MANKSIPGLPYKLIGKDISNETTSYGACAKANLNWGVELATLFTKSYADIDQSMILNSVTGYKAVRRDDNNVALSIVGSKYTPVQNLTSFVLAYDAFKYDTSGSEIKFDKAGSINGGCNTFISMKLPTGFQLKSNTGFNDEHELNLIILNSHDGKSPMKLLISPVRLYCTNMLSTIHTKALEKLVFRHTKSIDENIVKAKEYIMTAYQEFKSIEEAYISMSKVKVDDEIAIKVIQDLLLTDFQIEYLTERGNRANWNNILNADTDVIPTTKKNIIQSIANTIDSGIGQDIHRGSALWLYQGINCYYNNVNSYKDAENKFQNLVMNGTASKIDKTAFELCLELQ